jgi:hypothetical protein
MTEQAARSLSLSLSLSLKMMHHPHHRRRTRSKRCERGEKRKIYLLVYRSPRLIAAVPVNPLLSSAL